MADGDLTPATTSSAAGRGPVGAWRHALLNLIEFKGRTSRSEFLWGLPLLFLIVLALMTALAALVPRAIDVVLPDIALLRVLVGLAAAYAALAPIWALWTRRLHDSGHSGWWVVAGFVLTGGPNELTGPLSIGWFVLGMAVSLWLLILALRRGDEGLNRYDHHKGHRIIRDERGRLRWTGR